MQKQFKFKNYLIFIILLAVLVAPSFALASWWNPFSWHWSNAWNSIVNIFHKPEPAAQEQQKNTTPEDCPDGVIVNTLNGPQCDVSENEITDSWKTYKNNEFDFEINYPSNLTPHVNSEAEFTNVMFYSGDVLQTNLNGLFQIISIKKGDLSKYYCYDVSQLFAKSVGYDCTKEYTYTSCGSTPECSKIESIGNYKAIRFDEIGGGFHYLVKNNNTYLKISYYTGKTIDQNAINRMMDTFKFTNSVISCILEGKNYYAGDLCCSGLVRIPTTQSGTVGLCAKPTSLKINNIDYGFYLAKDSIEIFDKNGILLQSIKIGKDEIDAAEFDLKNYGHQIIAASDDVNYDGYKDLSIEVGNGYGGVNFFYNFYYFNPTTKKFVEVSELKNVCNPNVKYDQKKILSSCKDGPGYSDAIYQWGAPGYMLIKVPKIYRIDPVIVSVGNQVSIYGNNFSGFEGDLNLWIENPSGVKGIIYGDKKFSDDYQIMFTVPESVCQQDDSYSGLPCTATMQITPGNYKIFVKPWSAESNEVDFEIK